MPYPCRKCGKQIYWHKSSKTGKNYPTDSATDRRAFHQCAETEAQPPAKPITPDFSASLKERVAALEDQVSQLVRTIREVQARRIGDSDVAF